MIKACLPTAILLLLAGCGAPSPAENAADQLERAADQSDPAAATELENRAEAIRAAGTAPGNSSDPAGAVQNAMEAGGNAQMGNIR